MLMFMHLVKLSPLIDMCLYEWECSNWPIRKLIRSWANQTFIQHFCYKRITTNNQIFAYSRAVIRSAAHWASLRWILIDFHIENMKHSYSPARQRYCQRQALFCRTLRHIWLIAHSPLQSLNPHNAIINCFAAHDFWLLTANCGFAERVENINN